MNKTATVVFLAMVGVLILMAVAFGAGLPTPPADAPLLNSYRVACPNGGGYVMKVYDIDPTGPRAFVVYSVLPSETPFLVLIGTPGDFSAHLALPGRGVLQLSREGLMARYRDACEIVQQIVGSPA